MSTEPKPKLFDAIRIDPQKAADGIWVVHPELGDSFRLRRWLCPEHARSYLLAIENYRERHGDEKLESEQGQMFVQSVGIAEGLIVDWKISNHPDLAYDSSQMAAILAEPEYDDLRQWIVTSSQKRRLFRPEHVAGN